MCKTDWLILLAHKGVGSEVGKNLAIVFQTKARHISFVDPEIGLAWQLKFMRELIGLLDFVQGAGSVVLVPALV